ncbi:twitching motility response regulator PilH [Ramlibacter solisilvae]|uniref:Chemotaxis protein CheY n=1 Tax=Ramlibacter tataouinensis TaxID=94132 RepID=A0A127JVU4_9BURK|nr:response regulator [Ramlibacter tataouinensis]AMO24003.1 chemotaxis protein CheY [Ramlibacter tataouinensis]
MTRNILIVEDSQVDRARLEKLLSGAGYMVSTAENGEQAIAAVKRNKPDAVLMDVNMPGMDGFAATRALRGDASTKDIPVVLVTAKDQKADKAWGQMLGAKGYVTKPYTDDQLLAQVRAL